MCLLFHLNIYLSFSVEAPHTAALTLLDKEVTESITKSSLFQPVYKNNSLDLKEKRKKTHFPSLAEGHLKKAMAYLFYFILFFQQWQLFLTHTCMCTQQQTSTQELFLSCRDLALINRSQSERICGIVASTLPQTLSLFLSMAPTSQVSMTPADFTREHSKGLLNSVPGHTNLFPLKIHTL